MQVQACDKCKIHSTETRLFYLFIHRDIDKYHPERPQPPMTGFGVGLQSTLDGSQPQYCRGCLNDKIEETLDKLEKETV